MKQRYRLFRRGNRSTLYCVDTVTQKRTSLGTSDRHAAVRVVAAKNEAHRQPALNLQLARAYMAGADSDLGTRTWGQALDALISTKSGANRCRWLRVKSDKAFGKLFPLVLTTTAAEVLLKVLQEGTVSTNVFLRRLHNYCVDMNWLPWTLIPKRQWPAVKYKPKRSITADEHTRIIDRERNPERRAFYQLAWSLGAAQSDLAHLLAEDIDRDARVISFFRKKTGEPARIKYGTDVHAVLETLPKTGPLFPMLMNVEPGHRATEFRQRCLGLGIRGVTLHSYRYGWAERAKAMGFPERYAQINLGHGSKAVHRAYAKGACADILSLDEWAARMRPTTTAPVIPFSQTAAG